MEQILQTPLPLVSVITPVLNRARTIEGCLASVANQSYATLEHIVIDGGSSDGTLEIIERSRLKHLRWLSEPDAGMYDAINKGLKMATGDIVAYLNSDDLYLPWTIEVAVRELQREADLVYGDLAVVHRVAGSLAFHLQFYRDFDLRHYSYVAAIGQPTVFWRKSLTDRIGLFDVHYHLIGDCEYWLRAGLSGARLSHVREVMAVQVEHESTLRATQQVKLRDEFARLRQAMTAMVDPPRLPGWQAFKKSVVWRIRILQFFWEMRSRRPRSWPHLVKALRARGVPVTLSDLLVLAPARWRRDASLFRESAAVYGVLGVQDRES